MFTYYHEDDDGQKTEKHYKELDKLLDNHILLPKKEEYSVEYKDFVENKDIRIVVTALVDGETVFSRTYSDTTTASGDVYLADRFINEHVNKQWQELPEIDFETV